jgi:phosphatidylglycerophosphate synthase
MLQSRPSADEEHRVSVNHFPKWHKCAKGFASEKPRDVFFQISPIGVDAADVFSEGMAVGKRVSHSVLDPYLSNPIKARYDWFCIPKRLPPEAIVFFGHLLALAGGVGFAYSTTFWWGGLLAACGVVLSHVADLLDGTHARRTGQCRNGGELLDHFLDPMSFSYLLIGLCLSCGRWDLATVAVLCLYATAVLTNIKAKLIGEFTLASFGPTEFKTLLAGFGLFQMIWMLRENPPVPATVTALWFITMLLLVGIIQLIVNLVKAVIEVNRHGSAPDTTEWISRDQ